MRIVKATQAHVKPISREMRQQDIAELSKIGTTPEDALSNGLKGEQCYTVLLNEKPIMMFGLNRDGLSSAVVWALGTDGILNMRRRFIKESIVWRDIFLKDYLILHNYVDEDNYESIKWLKYLGAKFDKPVPYGTGTFMRFEFNV